MMACSNPPAITGGSVITSAPYNDGDIAVYTCNTGYVMSGTAFITCSTGVWSTSPSCALQYQQNINVTNTDNTEFPTWLVYFVAAVLCLLALLFLICILVCCFQLCGGGGLFGQPLGCKHMICCGCCRSTNQSYQVKCKSCTTFPRRYHYDENGHRYHIDDLGRRCYYEHRNRNGKFVTVTSVTPETESSVNENNMHYVNETNHDKSLVEKKVQPAKELLIWKPHVHPVRNINTSTK